MTTQHPAPADPMHVSRWLRLALLASLALNLTLGIGLLWLAKSAPPEKGLRAFVDARRLPKPDQLHDAFAPSRRHLADAALAQHRQGLRQHVDALWSAREQVHAAARAHPFQARDLEAAFASLRQAETEAAAHAHALFLDLMTQADAAERENLIAVIAPRSRHPHPRERGKRSRGHKPPLRHKDAIEPATHSPPPAANP